MSTVQVTFAGMSSLPANPVISLRRRATVAAASSVQRGREVPTNLYQVLRVTETATAREIKTAYRSMAKRSHPDASPQVGGGAADFIEIRRAYETLSNPAARAQYDRSAAERRREPRTGGIAQPVRFRSRRWETDQCW
ncbi:chaperone protein dnaJ 11, chloroplastic-like [Zingiber officinale]|uniref:chaperone protein dnaJ 11, chloroplastic-like n=1 Tax=Zingiber officinale TaxID=94328 RepID=UPI001C4C38E7|nr:chaperone protein dnaJ 11, chloroplastic-like [Zingiber officinale]